MRSRDVFRVRSMSIQNLRIDIIESIQNLRMISILSNSIFILNITVYRFCRRFRSIPTPGAGITRGSHRKTGMMESQQFATDSELSLCGWNKFSWCAHSPLQAYYLGYNYIYTIRTRRRLILQIFLLIFNPVLILIIITYDSIIYECISKIITAAVSWLF